MIRNMTNLPALHRLPFAARMGLVMVAAVVLAMVSGVSGTVASGSAVSDEFDTSTLSSIWSFADPVGDSSVSVANGQASITVPGGVNHDIWRSGVDAARILQTTDDTDFEIEVKFDSEPSLRYQLQGILIQQTPQDVLRFGIYSSGSGRRHVFAAHVDASSNSASAFMNERVTISAPIYLKVTRTGDTWDYQYSDDGSNWIPGTTFDRAITVAEVGVYSGNVGSPSHTALVDYFHYQGPTPAGSITTSTVGSGTVAKSPDQTNYSVGDVVALTATPDTGWVFDSWTGDISSTENPVDVTVTGDMNITAVFVDDPDTHTLSLSSTGFGTATGTPDQAFYSTGTVVQLDATPDPGSIFDSWSGDVSGSSNPQDVTISSDTSVTANFVDDPNTHVLSVGTSGSGTVSKTPDQAFYNTGDLVSVSATPAAGWIFDGWTGDVTSTDNPLDVTVNSNTTVTANFVPDPNINTFTVSTIGDGSVTKSPDQSLYSTGDVVQLTATPQAGWIFDSWSGDAVGSVNPIDVTVTGDMNVTATFVDDPNTHTVSVSTSGSGTAVVSPDQPLYTDGEIVQFTATPASGWNFDSWAGDVTGTQNPMDVTVTSDLSVTAVFTSPTFVGDEFNEPVLDPGWAFVDPVGDSSFAMTGTQVAISVPADVNHDIWRAGIDAARIMRQTDDEDFEIEVKIDSNVTERHQLQGILVQDSPEDVLRFGYYSSGSSSSLFAARVNDAIPRTTIYLNQEVALSAPMYLRVNRTGDTWTYSYSDDGANWTVADTFTRAITVSETGVYAGNVSGPAHTAIFDYFRFGSANGVTVQTVGSGSVTKSPDQSGYEIGDVVQLQATADAGWTFDSWSGDLTGSQNPADLTVTGDMNVTATFVDDPNTHIVTLGTAGAGAATKSPDQTLYDTGDVVQLTATPTAGWVFDSWSGDITGSTNPVDVTVTADLSITAVFVDDPDTHTVTTSTSGAGSVSNVPSKSLYSTGEVVQLTANPSAGWVFDSWTGDLTGSANPADLTVTGDMNVTAVFTSTTSGDTVFDIFYGETQQFNNIGRPQVWVNVLGNVFDPEGVDSLSFKLNGGPSVAISMGGDTRRLEEVGDFNVEIAFDELTIGDNQIELTAVDGAGNASLHTVLVNYPGRNIWPTTYSIDWSTVTDIQEAVQIIDGEWAIGPNGINNIGHHGYDRLFGLGDIDWTDYRIEFSATVHGVKNNIQSGGLALAMRWNGHTNSPQCSKHGGVIGQPHCGWNPYGYGMWYSWDENGGVSGSFDGDTSLMDSSGLQLLDEVTYNFKLEVENLSGGGSIARKKVWEASQPEPTEWTKESSSPKYEVESGAFLFIAHQIDVTVGDITVSPITP